MDYASFLPTSQLECVPLGLLSVLRWCFVVLTRLIWTLTPGLQRPGARIGAARHGAPITAVAASFDGAFLFSGAADGSLFMHVRCPSACADMHVGSRVDAVIL